MAWPGGKDGAGVSQRLINQIPPHDVFVSAFLGDCAIMRRKLPAAVSIGIDKSRANVERWAAEQSRPDLRLFCCCGIEWLRHHFGLYLVAPPHSAAKARRNEQKVTKETKAGRRRTGPQNLATVDRPPHFSAAEAVVAGNGDAADGLFSSLPSFPSVQPPVAAGAAKSGGGVPLITDHRPLTTFVYLDPPYLLDSRRSRRQLYEWELTDDQHAELLDTSLRLPCLVMISHYPHPLYARSLAGWRSFTFQSQTRGGRSAVEQVWCNYPPPAELHDARFVGGNKRERERVRRRVRNWTQGLARMQPAERQAVLDQIAARWLPA